MVHRCTNGPQRVKGFAIPRYDFLEVIVTQQVLFQTLLERIIFIKTLQINIVEYLKRLFEKKSVIKSLITFSLVLLHSHAKWRKSSKTFEQVYLHKNIWNICSHNRTWIHILLVENFHLKCHLTYLWPCYTTVPAWLLL